MFWSTTTFHKCTIQLGPGIWDIVTPPGKRGDLFSGCKVPLISVTMGIISLVSYFLSIPLGIGGLP